MPAWYDTPGESWAEAGVAAEAGRGGIIAFAGSTVTSTDVTKGSPPPPAILAAAAVGDILLDADNVNAARSATLSADAEITLRSSRSDNI